MSLPLDLSIEVCKPTHTSGIKALGDICFGSELEETEEVINTLISEGFSLIAYANNRDDGDRDIVPMGYIITHSIPSKLQPPLLNTILPPPSPETSTLFIHDLSVNPASRGQSLGPRLFNAVLSNTLKVNGNITDITLISVQNSQAFWTRLGFQIMPEFEISDDFKKSYGPCVYMERKFDLKE